MQKWLIKGRWLWKSYRPRVHQWLKSLRARHVNLFFALVFSLGGAVVVTIVAASLLALWLNVGTQRTSPADLTRLALTIAAGVGGVVALVVAYRRQRDLEQGRFVEAFGAAAKQLGDADVAVRLAGVYAMAGVADQVSKLKRQQCIDVLCGYLRLPYSPELGNNHQLALLIRKPALQEGDPEQEIQFQYRQNDKVVRQTIVRVIAAHLQKKAPSSWSSNDFDFTGCHFEQANFGGAAFTGTTTSFNGTTFSGETTSFDNATFSGKHTWFNKAAFTGEHTRFHKAAFIGGTTSFGGATFSSKSTWFDEAVFSGETTSFNDAVFSGEDTWFNQARFGGGTTSFDGAGFSGETIKFDGVAFSGEIISFSDAAFSGETTSFDRAGFSGEDTWFYGTTFSGETTSFDGAEFSGETTSFDGAAFSGKITSFYKAAFSGETTTFDGAAFSGKITTFIDAAFSGKTTSFDGAAFSGEDTSFRRVDFGVGKVSFEDPKAWTPAPVFDWETESTAALLKPANVKPEEWPPLVGR